MRDAKRLRRLPEDAVGSLLDRFLYDPENDGPFPALTDLSEDEAAALETVQQLVHADRATIESSAERQADVVDVLTADLMARVTTSARGVSARGRLANRGWLRLSDYDWRWTDGGDAQLGPGLSRIHALELMRSARLVTHLPSFFHGDAEQLKGLTLLVCDVVLDGQPPFSLVVMCARAAAKLTAMVAVRLPSALAPSSRYADAASYWRAVCDAYGLPLKAVDRVFSKFFLHERYAVDSTKRGSAPLVAAQGIPGHEPFVFFASRMSPLGVIEIEFAIYLDMTRYKSDPRLFPHGFK